VFENRPQAGRQLALALGRQPAETVTLGLTRGGIPVAAETARLLGTPLDLCAVRKIGSPNNPELALGAVASGGIRIFNPDLAAALGIDESALEDAARQKDAELQRVEAVCRSGWPALDLEGRHALLVDDGVATGATLRAAAASVRARGASRVTIAAPAAPAEVLPALRTAADAVLVLITPEPFLGVGACYREFPQVQGSEVARLLEESRTGTPPRPTLPGGSLQTPRNGTGQTQKTP
jgi:putative phosphoribosyl transferase